VRSLIRTITICLGLTQLGEAYAGGGREISIALYGNSFMQPVADALDFVSLPYERIPIGDLQTLPPDSLDALFLAYDATGDDATISWLDQFAASGGRLFTFFILPPRLQELHGITQGEFISPVYDGQFAQISSNGTIPDLPLSLFQNSWNIHTLSPADDSTRVVASWRDSRGRDTGFPAMLIGPAGAHLTHVLLGHDHEGAAWLYTALLAHFFPEIWPQAIHGTLAAVAGRQGELTSSAAPEQGSEVHAALKEADAARVESEGLLAQSRFGEALQEAFVARRRVEVAAAGTQTPRVGELRGVWMNDPQRLHGTAEWRAALDELTSAGFNALFVKVEDGQQTENLQRAVRAGHEAKVEVHAWKRTFNLSGRDETFIANMRREGRLQMSADGEELQWLCPSHPANIAHEIEAVSKLLKDHRVDGIHLDYIRYVSARSCFDEGCRLRFSAQTGLPVPAWPDDVLSGPLAEAFQTWRGEQITRLVRAIGLRARTIRPAVKISAAVFADWSQTRHTLGQDWVQWIDEGMVDFVCPMSYTTNLERFRELVRKQVHWVDGRVPLYVGIGAWQIPSVHELLQQIASTRDLGADGFVMFAYDGAFSQHALPVFAQALSMQNVLPPHWGPAVEFAIEGTPHDDEPTGTNVYPEGELISVAASVSPGSSRPTWTRAAMSLRRLDDGIVYELGRHSRRGLRRWLPFLPGSKEDNRISSRFAPISGDFRLVVEGEFDTARGRKKRFISRGPVIRVRSRALLDSLESNVSH